MAHDIIPDGGGEPARSAHDAGRGSRRAIGVLLLAALGLVLTGDRGRAQNVVLHGVDPLQALDLQIRPNVLVVLASSGSMRFPAELNVGGTTRDLNIGGDDPVSRLFQAKEALKTVLDENAGRVNFGFAQFDVKNADKRVNQPSFLDSLGNGSVGPLTYVSFDANADTWTGGFIDFFAATASPTIDFLGTSSAEVYNSFRPFNQVYSGAGCTPGTNCRRYLYSRILRDNVAFQWNTALVGPARSAGLLGTTSFTCPLPPAGLFPQDRNTDADATRTDRRRPCVQMTDVLGQTATFFYTSATWEIASGGGIAACPGGSASFVRENVAPCGTQNVATIKGFLKPELPIDGSCGDTDGMPCKLQSGSTDFVNNTTTALQGNNPAGGAADTLLGVLSAQNTPLASVLAHIGTNTAAFFPNKVPGQRHFVLLITDRDDDCGGNPAAAALSNFGLTDKIETLVVGFGLNTTTLNDIADKGSGGARKTAFFAANADDLVAALNQALTVVESTGEFAASDPVVASSVFEYGGLVKDASGTFPFDPEVPKTRYGTVVPILYQPTFEVPGYAGHMKAFINDAGTAKFLWDAGDMLCRRVTGSPAAATKPATCGATTFAAGGGPFGFATLVGNVAFDANSLPINVGTSSAKIKRRLYTSCDSVASTDCKGNGVSPVLAPLWPPNIGVAPTSTTYPAGKLDKALGLSSMTLTQLQAAPFYACLGTNPPGDCGVAAKQLGAAKKEAREMLLAFMAGAEVVRNPDGTPNRPGTGSDKNQLVYKPRNWFLADSTASAPAVLAPPPELGPSGHLTEYKAYLGPLKNVGGSTIDGLDKGFGLRDPDPQTSPCTGNKCPSMTVVYFGTNAMLHAFRAGPSCGGLFKSDPVGCRDIAGGDSGGEELWGYVPFDQLPKLKRLMSGQTRADHVYMIASPARFADIFKVGTVTDPAGISRPGVWRKVLLFGRGIGGKHYTALDVTAPGNFKKRALETNPPAVFWSRGNPDTTDGTPGGTHSNTLDADKDFNAYATMGETWSVPAIGNVDATKYKTARTPGGIEWVAFTGSGYGSGAKAAGEGTTFYSLDARYGDVIASVDVGDGDTTLIDDNALVASPAAFNPLRLTRIEEATNAVDRVTAVYLGDLHGRLWKFDADSPGTKTLFFDFGPKQPIGDAVALVNYNSDASGLKPHIFGATGDDRRAFPPPETTPPFLVFGFRDDSTAGSVVATQVFDPPLEFPDNFRGIAQPLIAFNDSGNARVFVAGSRFNPGGSTDCQASFDGILFAVTAASGDAGYDFNPSGDDRYHIYTGQFFQAPPRFGDEAAGGGFEVVVDDSLKKDVVPPPPPPPPQSLSKGGPAGNIAITRLRMASPVCR